VKKMRSEEVGRSLALFLLSFAVVLSIVFVIIGAQRTNAGSSDPPTGIHLNWNEDDTAHTIVVTWITVMDNAGDNVKYGINSGNYTHSVVGSHHTYSGAGEWVHDVELTGLSPNTIYYFICGGDNGGWSGERSFRTAPDNSMAFRFVAGGDSRSGADWPTGRDSVSQAMAKFNPSFVLFSGDFAYQGDYQWEWDNWLDAAEMYWVDNNNLSIPIIPCLGNHEMYGNSGASYIGQFSLPVNDQGNDLWYSLDWGPNLHITVLDTQTTMTGAQLDFLRQDLAAHENYLWKVVLFHEPPYSDGPDGSNSAVQRYWVPVFDNYHVDLVICGHNHLYERTYRLENGTISDNGSDNGTVYGPDNGTIYIVSGGWGAPLYTGSPSWFAAVGPISEHHFTVVDILDNGMLKVRAVDTDGNVLDEFSVQKTVSVPQKGKPISISPVVISAVVVIVVCIAAAFYMLKIRKGKP
jgi:hypothetical protein